MPEIEGKGFDVSREEERYLRRTFRRFALPYVIAGFALGVVAGALPQWRAPIGAAPSVDATDPRVQEELASIRGEVAALSQRAVGAEAALAKTRDRLVAIEQRVGEGSEGQPADTAALEERMDATRRRVDTLESRLGSAGDVSPAAKTRTEDQLAMLGSRLARVEGELREARSQAPPAAPAP